MKAIVRNHAMISGGDLRISVDMKQGFSLFCTVLL